MIDLKDSGVEFFDSTHEYWLGETRLQGITSILTRQLFPEQYKDIPDYILNRAAERGTQTHDLCRSFDLFSTYIEPADDRVREYVNNYVSIRFRKEFNVIESEYLVTDKTHYASAIDKVIEMNGEIILADIKTTYDLNPDYISWQLSIYKYLFEAQTGLKVSKLWAIWVRNEGEIIEMEDKGSEAVIKLLELDRKGLSDGEI